MTPERGEQVLRNTCDMGVEGVEPGQGRKMGKGSQCEPSLCEMA